MKTVLTVAALSFLPGAAVAETWRFDVQKPSQAPQEMSCSLTGRGRPGLWRVVADSTAPSAPNVLAQTDADSTGYRFPVCVVNGVTAADLDLSVRFKPVSGAGDQAG